MTKAGIRDLAKTISPPWLSTGVGEKYLYVPGLADDLVIEKVDEGMLAHMPLFADPSALPLLGAERNIPQGPGESASGYAARLSTAFVDWQKAGLAWAILRQEIATLTPNAVEMRLVTNSSGWYTYFAGADTTQPPAYYPAPVANWKWDNSGPPYYGTRAWWRIWIVVYPPLNATLAITNATPASPVVVTTATPHDLSNSQWVYIANVGGTTGANGIWQVTVVDATHFSLNTSTGGGSYTSGGTMQTYKLWNPGRKWGDGWKWGDGTAWGFGGTPQAAATLDTIAQQWKGAHGWLPSIIIAWDPTMFDPSLSYGSSNLPNGLWGTWAKTAMVGGIPTSVASRDPRASYIDGTT